MLIDTHCHPNFKIFRSSVDKLINRAHQVGVERLVVVGADLKNSRVAVRQARQFVQLKAAVGVHPHHVWHYLQQAKTQNRLTGETLVKLQTKILAQVRTELIALAQDDQVVAIGEVGFDRHFYDQTQYETLKITQEYLVWQRAFFIMQAEIARDLHLALIIHNREAVTDLFEVFRVRKDLILTDRTVFHCCQPDERLLQFAQLHHFFIGVDGDVTYDQKKEKFIKKVPLNMLVLETDSPYLLPEPERSQKKNLRFRDRAAEPKHVAVIAQFIADLKKISISQVAKKTTENAQKLFQF